MTLPKTTERKKVNLDFNKEFINTFSQNIENGNSSNPNIVAIKKVLNKVNEQNNPTISLEQVQKENETARIRCIGLTIETKSDYGKLIHGNQMLKLGCTRVEIGIQSIYDEVLKKTNRDNTVQDNIESIRILKDLGFKINAHYMPGLPYTTKAMDQKGLKELFASPDYKPDMLKIYPCMVMSGTKLYDEWKSGKFTPLTTKQAAELIAEMKNKIGKSDKTVKGFNLGINSGVVAGQTIMHCHIHLIPRRKGDIENPSGGVRGVIPSKQKY